MAHVSGNPLVSGTIVVRFPHPARTYPGRSEQKNADSDGQKLCLDAEPLAASGC
jgi:hypothetical protein